MIASTSGPGPHDMGGSAWFLMTLMTVFWLIVAVAVLLAGTGGTASSFVVGPAGRGEQHSPLDIIPPEGIVPLSRRGTR